MKLFFLTTLFGPCLLLAQSGLRTPASSQNELKLWQETNPQPKKPSKRAVLSLVDCREKVLNVDVNDSSQMWKRDDVIGSCLQPAIGVSQLTVADYNTCMDIAKLGWKQKRFFEGICKENLSYSKCEADALKVTGDTAKLTAQYKCMVRHTASLPTKKCQTLHPVMVAKIKEKGLKPAKEDSKILRSDFCELSDKPFINPISEPSGPAEQR